MQQSNDDNVKYLMDNISTFPDFPKPGIMFRDTLSLFRNPVALKKIIDLFSDYIVNLKPDVIVGLEARGFVLGGAIAYKLNLPFVPVRKKGKLPGKIISFHYDLEYGQDVFEIQEGSILPGQKVVIVDDLLATGGSCAAAIELISKMNAQVIECVVLVELTKLNWQEKIKVKATSFIKYDS